jgi:dephospho-CoA kinase
MIKVGITGNIGSGKSTVARLFEMLDVPVFYADQEAREISKHEDVLKEIRYLFGDKVVGDDGLLVRSELAAIVFNDKEKLALLNSIIHPRVSQCFNDWCTLQQSIPYVLIESAILFESGLTYLCDRIIVVTAPEAIRIQRVVERDHFSPQEVILRMRNQWDESKLVRLSDYEIVNDDYDSLIEQVKIINVSLKVIFV